MLLIDATYQRCLNLLDAINAILLISSSQLLQAVYIQQLAASSCLYLAACCFQLLISRAWHIRLFFRVRPILIVFIFNCSKKKRFRSFSNLLFIFHLFRSFPHLKIVSPVKSFVQKIVWSVNPISAGVLASQGMLGGGCQFDPPSSKSHV